MKQIFQVPFFGDIIGTIVPITDELREFIYNTKATVKIVVNATPIIMYKAYMVSDTYWYLAQFAKTTDKFELTDLVSYDKVIEIGDYHITNKIK